MGKKNNYNQNKREKKCQNTNLKKEEAWWWIFSESPMELGLEKLQKQSNNNSNFLEVEFHPTLQIHTNKL